MKDRAIKNHEDGRKTADHETDTADHHAIRRVNHHATYRVERKRLKNYEKFLDPKRGLTENSLFDGHNRNMAGRIA